MNHSELAAFLKSRRDRIRPSDVGLPTGPRRRVPGLRREEVASRSSSDDALNLLASWNATPDHQPATTHVPRS